MKIGKEPLKKDLAAIIVAAGYSSRMNSFKPLLPLGDLTVIETTVNSFLYAGINNITVVIGFEANKLKPVIEVNGAKWVYNERFNEGMYSSIVTGVMSLNSEVKGAFFLPADIPLVKSQTIDKICNSLCQTQKPIIFPVFNGRRGHPPLISSQLFTEIKEYDGTGGLKTLLRKYTNQSHYLEVEDEGILLDIDTYEDYLRLSSQKK